MRFLAAEYVKMNLDQLLTDIMKANLKPVDHGEWIALAARKK
jgi:hypothetical protein